MKAFQISNQARFQRSVSQLGKCGLDQESFQFDVWEEHNESGALKDQCGGDVQSRLKRSSID